MWSCEVPFGFAGFISFSQSQSKGLVMLIHVPLNLPIAIGFSFLVVTVLLNMLWMPFVKETVIENWQGKGYAKLLSTIDVIDSVSWAPETQRDIVFSWNLCDDPKSAILFGSIVK